MQSWNERFFREHMGLVHTRTQNKAGTRKNVPFRQQSQLCAPCFPKSRTLESLFHKIVEERFKRTVLMPRQDKCTFQKRPSSTSFTSEDKKKKKNIKHNEMRTDIVWCPSEIKEKKKNLHGLGSPRGTHQILPRNGCYHSNTYWNLTTWCVHIHNEKYSL